MLFFCKVTQLVVIEDFVFFSQIDVRAHALSVLPAYLLAGSLACVWWRT